MFEKIFLIFHKLLIFYDHLMTLIHEEYNLIIFIFFHYCCFRSVLFSRLLTSAGDGSEDASAKSRPMLGGEG